MNDLIEWEEAVWAVAPRDVISAVGSTLSDTCILSYLSRSKG